MMRVLLNKYIYIWKAKHESAITRLEMELKEAKTFHRQELNSLKDKVHSANTDANHCRNKLSETEQVSN